MLVLKKALFINQLEESGNTMNKKTLTIFILLLLGVSINCHAQGTGLDSQDLFDNILIRFSNTASLWTQTFLSYAKYLFWSLTLISMVWTYGLMALKKADIQEFMAETVRFLVSVGFFFWITFRSCAKSKRGNNTISAPSSSA